MKKVSNQYKKWILFAGIGVLLALSFAFYRMEGKMPEAKEINVIYVSKVMDNKSDFWVQLFEGMKMAAEDFGVSLRIVGPEQENNYVRQNELIEWAIAQNPQAIILSPSSYTETTAAAQKITDNKIKLIFIDSALEGDIAQSIVATDNIMAGAAMGKYIHGLLTENSKIAIIGHVKGSSTAIEREQGLRQGLKEDEEKIVDVVFCDSDYEKAYDLMIGLVEKYPDITMLAGLNEYSAVGAARAIKKLGLSEKIQVVGFDNSLEEIQLLEEGIMQGIVIQKPFKMGYLGMEATVKAVKGEPLSKHINSGFEIITKENMYTEENQKFLFPFEEE